MQGEPGISVRLALALVVHIAMGLVAVGLVMLLTRDETSMVPALVQRLFSQPSELTALRGEAAGHMILWCLVALTSSFIMACLWVLRAEQALAMDKEGASSRSASWALLLLGALTVAAIVGYMQIFASAVNLTLNAQTLAVGGIVMLVTVLVGYYIATLFAVRRTMRPSVPFSPHF